MGAAVKVRHERDGAQGDGGRGEREEAGGEDDKARVARDEGRGAVDGVHIARLEGLQRAAGRGAALDAEMQAKRESAVWPPKRR